LLAKYKKLPTETPNVWPGGQKQTETINAADGQARQGTIKSTQSNEREELRGSGEKIRK